MTFQIWKRNICLSTQAICTEAGLLALRERRMKVTQTGESPLSLHLPQLGSLHPTDLRKAKDKALYRKKGKIPEGLYI